MISQLPDSLFHWTAAEHAASIRRRGLLPKPGGFLGFHSREPAVCLAIEADCRAAFNPAVVLAEAPLRVTVRRDVLNAQLFGPDLNALLDPMLVFVARRYAVDLTDPQTWTVENSLRFAGCLRYLSRIPPSALQLQQLPRPDQLQAKANYVYSWADSERRDLRDTIDRIVDAARDYGVDAAELKLMRIAFQPLKEWSLGNRSIPTRATSAGRPGGPARSRSG